MRGTLHYARNEGRKNELDALSKLCAKQISCLDRSGTTYASIELVHSSCSLRNVLHVSGLVYNSHKTDTRLIA